MKNVALHNLGCKVNSYELEVMQQSLIEKGYNIVPFDEIADIYIVNTCTVTNIADRKSRQMLHRAKQKNPNAIVVAVGCYVQTGLENIKKDDCIDLAISNNRKSSIAEIVEKYLAGREDFNNICNADNVDKRDTNSILNENLDNIIDVNKSTEYESMTLTNTAEHTRAYIKIQDGCNQFCSYCAIPLARGRVRSRKHTDIIEEIKGIAKAGYKEIVLTGIHISSYGIDFSDEAWKMGESQVVEFVDEEGNKKRRYTEEPKIVDLIEQINEIEGIERIRLGSFEPRIITRENAKRLSKVSKICPHFHLSLQSGCDETLVRMNRRYNTEEYYASVCALREFFDELAITTDVIVGFPGETDEEFEATKKFLEKIKFYEMHIFKYSKRAGTKAAAMKEQIPENIKHDRSSILLDMEKKHSIEFRSKYIGQTVEVLLEETKLIEGIEYFAGYTRDYVYVAIPNDNDSFKSNELVKVRIKAALTDEILLGNLE